ncbi:MAG: RraA family protein, partial [Jannaschia sp.]
QRVETGDMIVADRDGVVVIPFALLDAVIIAVRKVAEAEHALDRDVEAGLAEVGLIKAMLESGEEIGWV